MPQLLAEVSGQGGSVALATAKAQVKGWKLTPKGDVKDVTHMGSGGYKYPRIVLKSCDGSFDVEAYPGDLVGSVLVGTFINSAETGSKTYSGSFLVTEEPIDTSFDDIAKWTVAVASVGSVAIS